MRNCLLKQIMTMLIAGSSVASWGASDYVPQDYIWTTPSHNSSESMPCGGHDVGMNVWVEGGDVLFYAAQSGWFDENNTLLKAGRWRLHFAESPFAGTDFRQILCLDEGCVYVKGGGAEVRIWVDVYEPVVFVTVKTRQKGGAVLSYESWRYQERQLTKAECQQCSYKWVLPADAVTHADSISACGSKLEVVHQNRPQTVFDFTVARTRMDQVKAQLHNPLGGRRMSLQMNAPGFAFRDVSSGKYVSTDFRAWNFEAKALKQAEISIVLDAGDEEKGSVKGQKTGHVKAEDSRRRSAKWWHAYWQRSWIKTNGDNAEAKRMIRNYELMRYMLGCNAYSRWPSKFNGGLFTFDPVFVDPNAPFTPDYRKWGGGTMTAQNQRLVYWPMLKSGDWDLMAAQFATYQRLLPAAELWTKHHWGHRGACFSEQLENFGLPNPAEYGKHQEGDDWGVERNAWLEYEWDTVLEFCMMMLQARFYASSQPAQNAQDSPFTPHLDPLDAPFIESCLRFFDEHYQYLARQRGVKMLDGDGRLVIYPGSGCETYKQAYNPASTIAALRTVATAYSRWLTAAATGEKRQMNYADSLLLRLPDIPLRTLHGDTCIAPAMVWSRIQNVETPQLYPVFPWRVYGVGRKDLHIARNTYWKDDHALEMRSAKGWKQDNIWAACLGLTDEANRLNAEKLADGPYRFPAFWDAGFDWAPDLNRGGSGMIGLQEMLLQEGADGQLIAFPAWPGEWQVSFRLRASNGRVVEMSN